MRTSGSWRVTVAVAWQSLAVCAAVVIAPPLIGLGSMRNVQDKPEPRVINIVAKRYAFEPSIVEVTQGERVTLLVQSADGPHGFAIKELRIDKEVDRGQDPVKIEFTADKPGEFEILCTVICGEGHATMNGKLVVAARP